MALDDLLDEHEQSEKVRSWLQANALGVIGGIALGLGLIGAGQWWQQQQQNARRAAGERYQLALEDLQGKRLKQAQARLAGLGEGTYAVLGALQLAKVQVAAGQRDQALATLRAAQPSNPSLAAITTQRLARLLIDAGKPGDALKLLPAGTDAEALQLRGDAYDALGQRDQARTAYAQALVNLDVAAPKRRLVELKLSEVGGTPPKPEAKT